MTKESPKVTADRDNIMRLMRWLALGITIMFAALYWIDSTMTDRAFRSTYAPICVILIIQWVSIGAYHLLSRTKKTNEG